MKQRSKLLALSLLALAFAAPIGFRTANAKSRTSSGQPPPQTTETDRLCEAAGVDPKDVLWRIRSGLTAEQAIAVAVTNKLEGGG
jgi:hypothetical protein